MKNKFFSILLTTVFLVSLSMTCLETITSFAVENTGRACIYSDDIDVESGSIAEVSIKIKYNSGFSGFRIKLEYDENVFTPKEVVAGEVLLMDENAQSGYINDSIGGIATQNKGVDIVWTGTDDINMNGELFTVSFDISENISGNYEFGITYVQADTFNSSFEDVEFACEDFTVNVDNSFYEQAAKVYCEDKTVDSGSEFEIPVKIKNNSGINPVLFRLKYDATSFEVVSIKRGLVKTSYDNISSAEGELNFITDAIDKSLGDGVIVTVVMKVIEDAYGDYAFELKSFDDIISTGATITVVNQHGTTSNVIYTTEDVITPIENIFTVPIYIGNNSGILGSKMIFEFDINSFNFKEIVRSDLLKNVSFDYNEKQPGKITILWSGIDEISDDGEMFILKFERLKTELSEMDISVSYSQEDTFDNNYNDVILTCGMLNLKLSDNMYLFKKAENSTTFIKEETKTIYGLEEGIYDLEGYVEYEGCELEYNPTAFGFGTGTTVDIIVDGEVVDTYTIVIFGDINGDGYIDAFDLPDVMAFVNYESQYESCSAQEMAADINGDGFIDESDLFLADLASTFAYTIEQSR